MEVYRMSKGTTVGLILLAIGIILWIAYGLYLGFEELMQAIDLITGFIIGIVLIGIITLIISIILEQKQSTKEMKEKINKEDLKP
jgi:low affinity Fe/Cu permease